MRLTRRSDDTTMRSRRWTWCLRVTVALLVACAASTLAGPIREAAAQGRWTPTGSLNTGRRDHTATLLPSGQVLVAGGLNFLTNRPNALSSAELYDPATGKWTSTGSLSIARSSHTATLLPSGRVLVAGGSNFLDNGDNNALSSAELYDPATGQWTSAESLSTARSSHTATLLPSGQLLVAGGVESPRSAELYDPATRRWTPTGALHGARAFHTATLLPSGEVLVAGGDDDESDELYDHTTGTWTPTGPLNGARLFHTATLLPSGQVLVVADLEHHTATLLPSGHVLVTGGIHFRSGAELYDPATKQRTPTGALNTGRDSHTATLLPSGQVLVAGGDDSLSTVTNSAELYDLAIGRWTATGALGTAHNSHTATLLPSGQVLVAGGLDGAGSLSSAELYDPAIGRWTATEALGTSRSNHTATLLLSGHVLVAGGFHFPGSPNSLTSVERYDPATGRWTPTGALGTARIGHTATLLPSGQVLVAGGSGDSSAELYDPATGRWRPTGPLGTARSLHTATLLPSGQVLVAGGHVAANDPLPSAELYDPATGRWRPTGALGTARAHHTATLLPSEQVLVAGGGLPTEGAVVSSVELYDPATGRWTRTGALGTARLDHTATLLPSGQVLVAGGYDSPANKVPVQLSSAELYDPVAGRWTPTGPLATGRSLHTATLLPSGQVLVAVGQDFGPLTSAEIYDPGLGFEAAWRPNLTFVGPAAVGSALGVEGSLFLGLSEASGGGTQQSATNYPLVQLRRLDNEQTRFLLPDPSEPWTDSTFTSLPLSAFPPGPALLTVFTNGIPSVAKSIVVHAKTVGAPPPEPLRLGPVYVRPRRVALGDTVEVVTTLRAGGTVMRRLAVFFYDGDPEAGGQVFGIKRVGSLSAHAAREVRASFRPTRCGIYQLVVIAGKGTPFEAERTARPLHVDCGRQDRR